MAMGTPKAYYGGSSTVLPLERYNRTAIFASTTVVRVSTNTIVGPPHKGLSDGAIGGMIAGFLVFLFLLAPASAPSTPRPQNSDSHAYRMGLMQASFWPSSTDFIPTTYFPRLSKHLQATYVHGNNLHRFIFEFPVVYI